MSLHCCLLHKEKKRCSSSEEEMIQAEEASEHACAELHLLFSSPLELMIVELLFDLNLFFQNNSLRRTCCFLSLSFSLEKQCTL
jgi:hypothetical protein